MTYAIIRDGAAVEVYPGIAFVDAAGVGRSSNWIESPSTTSDMRTEAGVLDIVEPPAAPEGKIVRILGLDVVDGVPTRTFVVEDAPEPPPPAPFTVYKADIWRRCTDDEATKLDAAIRAQPVRLRRLFDDATLLRSDDELFGQIQGAVMQLLGTERASIILTASDA